MGRRQNKTEEEIGFNSRSVAKTLIDTITVWAKTKKRCLVALSLDQLKPEQRARIERVLLFVSPACSVKKAEFYLGRPLITCTTLRERIDLIEEWLVAEGEIGKAIQNDPNYLTDEANFGYVYLSVYLFLTIEELSRMSYELRNCSDFLNTILSDDLDEDTLEDVTRLRQYLDNQLVPIDYDFTIVPKLQANLADSQRKVTKLQSENDKLKKQTEETAVIERLRIQRLEEEKKSLQQKVQSVDEQIHSVSRVYDARIQKLEEERDTLKNRVETLEAQIKRRKDCTQTHPSKPDESIDLDISTMRVLVIGGHETVLQRIRKKFPNWNVPGDDLNSFKPTKLDAIVFFTDHCSHAQMIQGRRIAVITNAFEIFVNTTNPDILEKEIQTKLKNAISA